MTATVVAAAGRPLLKSYLSPEERAEWEEESEGDMDIVYLAESHEAGRAGDEETAWKWLAMAKLSARNLLFLKRTSGAKFIREMGFDTSKADVEYGAGWLDRDE